MPTGSPDASTTAWIDPALTSIVYVAPPVDLQALVSTLYLFRCDERVIHDIQPASGSIVFYYLAGDGYMHFADGRCEPSHPFSLLTPTNVAAALVVDGPFHCVGAALTPLGWAGLTGRSAAEWSDRFVDARTLFDADFEDVADAIDAHRRVAPDDADGLCARFADLLRGARHPVPPLHEQLVHAVYQWLGSSLNPPVEALFDTAPFARRQTQRLVAQYFGLPPKQLARKYRATRAAAMLADHKLSQDEFDGILQHFADQSHLIREVRLFAGRTPARLGGAETPILNTLLDVRNFRELS